MDNDFGNRLRELREEHELTMDYVVYDMQQKYMIEINKGQLSRWEHGQSPSMRCLRYLAMYYNVSADYLLGLTESKKPSARINNLITMLKQEHGTTDIEQVAETIADTLEKSTARAARRSSKPSAKLIARRQGAET